MSQPYKVIYHVYGLVCPLDNEVRYVGMTRNLDWRFQSHCSKNPKTPKDKMRWILKLRKKGLKPMLVILHEGEDKFKCLINERYYISKYKETILNIKKKRNNLLEVNNL